MKAKEFRALAWNALRGNWMRAMLVTLVAFLLSGTIASHSGFSFSSSVGRDDTGSAEDGGTHVSATEQADAEDFHSLKDYIDFLKAAADEAIAQAPVEDQAQLRSIFNFILRFFGVMLGVALVRGVLGFIFGGAVSFGLAEFNFRLLDGDEAGFRDLFSRMYIGKGIVTRLLTGLKIFFWTLLLIIPGIIKSFACSMTPYILSEHPDMRPKDAIRASEDLMRGNKWRYFCLSLSFIGWDILAALLTLSIGNLWLNPYKEAASAAFYREICRENAIG